MAKWLNKGKNTQAIHFFGRTRYISIDELLIGLLRDTRGFPAGIPRLSLTVKRSNLRKLKKAVPYKTNRLPLCTIV